MIGQQIQNYVIVSKLGQGGMGTVYKATDKILGREVALKMLNTLMINQPQVLDRFKKEAQVLARLLHPNIAIIYNLIEQEQQHFMVMEYVEGKNLDELLRLHKTLPYQVVVPIFIQALEGLHHAHKKGIFHRDIKPSNLILTPDGTVKLMDFGIAKVAGEQRMTQVNRVIGTVEFLAPEIIEGKEPSVASDIYAAAVTMYELLSGKLPFENNTDYSLMQEILKKKPVAPDKLNSAVPKTLGNIVMKALEKKPEMRFANAGEFQQALISAFPELKGADPGALSRQLETAYAAPPTQMIDQATAYAGNASLQATRMESVTRSGNVLKTIRQKYLSSTRSKIVATTALLVILILLGYTIFSKKDVPGNEVVQNAPVAGTNPQTDSNVKTENQGSGDNGTTGPVTQDVPKNEGKPPANPQAPLADPGKSDKDKKEQERRDREKREQEKRDQEKRDQEKKDQEKRDQEKRDQEKREQEQREQQKKEVVIGSRVEVELSLRDNLENAPERQDIPVTFAVTSPVVVNGVTVISKGAVANGVIKLGKVQTDIDINTVMAANGQQVRLKAQKAHGRRSDIVSNRNYIAIIQPGTRLSFQ